MCNACYCINIDKCSIRGYQPIGWCCEYCEHYNPVIMCKSRFRKISVVEERIGICIGCAKENVPLVWVYIKKESTTNVGFCQVCLRRYDKKKLLNIFIEKYEMSINIP